MEDLKKEFKWIRWYITGTYAGIGFMLLFFAIMEGKDRVARFEHIEDNQARIETKIDSLLNR